MNTITNKLRISIIGIVLNVLFIVPVAMGGDLTIPKSWVSGDTLTSTDLNSNFSAVEAAVDDNAADIVVNSDNITALENSKSAVAFDRTICTAGLFLGCSSDTLTTTASTVTSVTINAPTSGKVIMSFSGQYFISHTSGIQDLMCMTIGTSSTAVPFPDCDGIGFSLISAIDASHRLIVVNSGQDTGSYYGAIHSQQIFTVAAGNHTYYVRGQSNSVGTNLNLRQSNAIAYFIAD